MKKLLLFAGALAVMVSCQKTETTPDAPQVPQSKGLVFAIEKGDNTKAEYQSDFYTNWNAETDRIGIFYKNAGLGFSGKIDAATAYTMEDEWIWSGAAMAPAKYKATTSGPRGYFTAIDDANMLLWAKGLVGDEKEKPAQFAIYYPSDLVATAATAGSKPIIALKPLAAQTQTDENGASCVATNVMVQMTAPIKKSDLAVGEAIPMKLSRLYTVLPMKIKNSAAYGVLKSITVKAEKSNIATSDAGSYNFEKVTKNADGTYDYAAKGAMVVGVTPVKEVTLTVDQKANGFLTWNEDATAYVTVLPVARKEVSEKMTATYVFANATFTQTWNVSADWTPNMFVASTPVLDCATTPVFFGNGIAPNDVLYINEAFGAKSIKSLFDATTAPTGVKIGTTTVKFADIKAIYSSNTQLDIDGLEKFTELTGLKLANTTLDATKLSPLTKLVKVELTNATSIPARSFTVASALTHLTAPAVISIANDAIPAGKLEQVLLSKYKYASSAINAKIFSPALTVVDMSNVNAIDENMAVSMAGAEKLNTVMVKNGVELSEGTFKGFQLLKDVVLHYDIEAIQPIVETVTATVKLMGESVFEGAEALDGIVVSNTEVPANSFKGCGDLAVVEFTTPPTKIGASAFEATIIADIDLSAATEIGKAAFKGCAALVGKEDVVLKRNILNVDQIDVLNNDVFNGCNALTYVTFKSVTKVGNLFLAGLTPDVLVFGKPFAYDKTVGGTAAITPASFGLIGATALTVDSAQTGVQDGGKTLTITKEDFNFQSITIK